MEKVKEKVKCTGRYKETYDHNYFDTTCKSDRELEEIDLTNIIRRLK